MSVSAWFAKGTGVALGGILFGPVGAVIGGVIGNAIGRAIDGDADDQSIHSDEDHTSHDTDHGDYGFFG